MIKTDKNQTLYISKYQNFTNKTLQTFMSKGPSKLNRPEVSMSSILKPPTRIYQNKLKVPEISEMTGSSAVQNDSMPPYKFPLKEYTREILGGTNNSDFYNKTISKFFNKMRSTGVENYHNNGKAKNEMNTKPDSEAIIHNNYLFDKKMSKPRAFLEKVKKMKASKSSSNSAKHRKNQNEEDPMNLTLENTITRKGSAQSTNTSYNHIPANT